MSTRLATVAVLAAAWLLTTTAPGLAHAASPADPAAEPEAALDLSWMSGHWRSGQGEAFAEEIWTSPEGGVMLAVSRTVRGGQVVMFEFMRVELGDAPALVAQPGGGAGTTFTLVEAGSERAVFANPDNDYPTHIEYARDGADLTARIWAADGPGSGPSWRWSQVSE